MPADHDQPTATVLYLADAAHLADDPDDRGRPVHAFDAAGVHLDCFPTARLAHQWAHRRAARPDTPLPVELEDRTRDWTRQVWPNHCRLLLWPAPMVLPLSRYGQPPLCLPRPGRGQPS